MTDEKTRTVTTTAASGHVLALSRSPDGGVWLTIHASPTPRSTMGTRAPMMRVDREPAIDIQTFPEYGPTGRRQRVNDRRFSALRIGDRVDPENGILRQLVTGNQLRVRIFLDAGETEEVVFDLGGARQMIEPLARP